MSYNGCLFLEKCINFEDNRVCDCCINYAKDRGTPLLIDNYKGEPIDWDEFFKKKEARIERQKIADIDCCKGCYHLDDYKFQGVRKLSDFQFSQYRNCNCRCVYCTEEYFAGGENYDVLPILEDIMNKGYYEPGGEASFQGGEPTMMPHFEEIVNLLHNAGTYVRICTSGIKYSVALAEALKKGKSGVVISLDSGSSRAYKTIKRVDCFDIVVNNIKKYQDMAADKEKGVVIKYLIIPGYNDNLKEINAFFEKILQLGIKTVAVDLDCNYLRQNRTDFSEHLYFIYDYFLYKSQNYGIDCYKYCFILDLLKYRKSVPSKLVKYDFLYNILIKLNEDKTKNRQYF